MTEPAGQRTAGSPQPVEPAEPVQREDDSVPLPEPVRARVVALAAAVLPRLPVDVVPARLRRVVNFTPAGRVRHAATPLVSALQEDVVFRQRVAEAVEKDRPGTASSLRSGTPSMTADPAEVAALAYLLRPPGWVTHVVRARDDQQSGTDSVDAVRDAETALRLKEQLAAARAAAREERERLRAAADRLKADNAALRRKLQEARQRAERAERTAAEAAAQARAEQERSATAATESDAQLRRLRGRLEDAEAAVETSRRVQREGRSLEDARLRLLLDSVVEAAAGLRRELALPPVDARPADTVAALVPGSPVGEVSGRGLASDDPATLQDLLTLPQAHLVVDGYNVTKLEWGALTLEAQRNRLVSGLAGLAAQTGAEITCVFDGADLDVVPPVGVPRGVRVLFSPAGGSADEVIRQLVAAEPTGRLVLVVSNDREVIDDVRRTGARPVPSGALVRRLDR